MEFIKTLIQKRKQNQQKNTPQSLKIVQKHSQEENLSIQVTTQKIHQSSYSEEEQVKPIRTLMNFQRTQVRPKTLKQFKEHISPEKYQFPRSRTVIPFVQPQFLVKTLFEQHTLTLKINQVKYFSTSKKGLRNFQTLQNQDVIFIERIANIFKFFGVFDGHGQHGKGVAQFCSTHLKNFLKSFEQEFKRQISEKQIVDIVKTCLKKTQTYLHNAKYNEIQYSGTTALIVLITPRSIISFNVGNSRLLIGMKEQNTDNIYDFQVTHDHDLNRLDQRIRVKNKGAVITPLKDQLGQNFGPDRLWNKNQKRPGTFITRAFGLVCGQKAGIICDPEVSVLTYNKRMKFLVLASDGLWAVEQNDQVIEYLARYFLQGELGMGVQSLVEEAAKRWKNRTELMDDISIIAVGLSQQM